MNSRSMSFLLHLWVSNSHPLSAARPSRDSCEVTLGRRSRTRTHPIVDARASRPGKRKNGMERNRLARRKAELRLITAVDWLQPGEKGVCGKGSFRRSHRKGRYHPANSKNDEVPRSSAMLFTTVF